MTKTETEMLIIRKGDKLAAVLVDEFIGQSEIVLEAARQIFERVAWASSPEQRFSATDKSR